MSSPSSLYVPGASPAPKAKRKRKHGWRSGAWIRPELRWAVYHRDRFKCVWCAAVPLLGQLTLDHLYPEEDPRRTHAPSGILTACHGCNSRRKHTLPAEFAQQFGARAESILLYLDQIPLLPVDREMGKTIYGLFRESRGYRPPTDPAIDQDKYPFVSDDGIPF